jgi:ABC-type molybdate transport system substrate-binding protein
MRTAGRFVPVPEHAYPPIEQGAVVMRDTAHQQAAVDFFHYLLSPAGQALLEKGGLGPAAPKRTNAPAVPANAR